MPRELLIQGPDGQVNTIELNTGRLAVGRSSTVELSFPEDAGLSRQHFAFEGQGDDWTVQDLGSKNGTFVNNIPLKAKLILKPGDRITAGHLTIVFSPDSKNVDLGVVVFEGEEDSPSPTSSGGAGCCRSARPKWPGSAPGLSRRRGSGMQDRGSHLAAAL